VCSSDLAGLQRLFLDKTGTLTDTRPTWRSVQALQAMTADRQQLLLQRAASLAAWSQHPLSQALQQAVGPVAPGPAWHQVREHPGAGLEAQDEQGRRWRLGSARWLGLDPVQAELGAPEGELQAWFGPVGQPLLRLGFDEALRPDAAQAVQALRDEGVDLALLSGDAPARVRQLALRLGIAEAAGAATPEHKLAALRQAQARGERVGMVGDGVNDAPVLAQADVSFAMGQGALVARSQADAVILSNRLSDLVAARRLARRTLRVIRQNLAWSLAYNAVAVPLALAGWMPAWAAGIGMAASSLLVVANAARLSR
jgi:Cu2+-exporting ATPase